MYLYPKQTYAAVMSDKRGLTNSVLIILNSLHNIIKTKFIKNDSLLSSVSDSVCTEFLLKADVTLKLKR